MAQKSNDNKNGRIATKILIAFTFAFLISYPFHDNFWGGLISSMCCASMIGGLADWFAVTALFKKPLGSNILAALFRTQIIPKNRERIFEALVDMVQNELLTKENIKAKLKTLNSSEILIELVNLQKSPDISEACSRFMSSLMDKLHIEDINKFETVSEEFIKENLKNVDITEILADSVEWMTNNGYDEQLIEILLDKAQDIAETKEINSLIQNVVLEVLEMNKSNFLIAIIGFVIRANVVDIASFFQKMLVNYIDGLKDKDNKQRDKIRELISKYTYELREDEEFKSKIDAWKIKKIEENKYVYDKVSSFIHKEIEKIKDNNQESNVIDEAAKYVELAYNRFKENKLKQESFNEYIREFLAKVVDANHNKIGEMVEDRLDGISGEELALMIEPVIWNDLQLIRVNGSVVGGLVGVITYLITFWIE